MYCSLLLFHNLFSLVYVLTYNVRAFMYLCMSSLHFFHVVKDQASQEKLSARVNQKMIKS